MQTIVTPLRQGWEKPKNSLFNIIAVILSVIAAGLWIFQIWRPVDEAVVGLTVLCFIYDKARCESRQLPYIIYKLKCYASMMASIFLWLNGVVPIWVPALVVGTVCIVTYTLKSLIYRWNRTKETKPRTYTGHLWETGKAKFDEYGLFIYLGFWATVVVTLVIWAICWGGSKIIAYFWK